MSWQRELNPSSLYDRLLADLIITEYVDTSLVGTGDVDKAAIFSKAGDSKWAASPGFDIQPAELKALVKGYDNAAELQSNGLHIAKDRYVLLKADDRSIYGKKVCVILSSAEKDTNREKQRGWVLTDAV